MSSDQQPPSKRKRRSSSSGSSSKPPSNKMLLIRLSEGCISHHRNCHEHDDNDMLVNSQNGSGTDTDANKKGGTSQQCVAAMESLKSIVPMIETATFKCKQVDPKDIVNLCMFYISVIRCTYCPYSMELLFDNGRGGAEILPRVHQLLCHLSSEPMVQDTWKTLSKSHKKQRAKKAEGSTTSTTTSGVIVAADQISHAIAVLLDAIPESHVYSNIVQDIIQMIQDLNALAEIGVLDDPHVDKEQIEVVVFSQSHVADNRNGISEAKETTTDTNNAEVGDKTVPIGSLERLLMLQSCLFQVLFHLFVMQYTRHSGENIHGDGPGAVEREEEKNVSLSLIESGSFILLDHHKCDILLSCIRQVVETNPENKSSALGGSGASSRVILLMRGKIMACNVLFLLLPGFGRQSTHCTDRWMELMDMVSAAVLQQVKFLVYVGRYEQLKSDSTWKDTMDSLLATLVTLLRDIHVSPPMQRLFSLENQMWRMRLQSIFKLLDCLPFIAKVGDCSLEMERLSMMILQVIHVALSPQCGNSSLTSDRQKIVHRMIHLVLEYCTLNSIYPGLFDLAHKSTFNTLAVSIIQRIWCYICSCGNDQFVLDRAFKSAMHNQGNSNKRRKYETHPRQSGCDKDDELKQSNDITGRMTNDSTFVSVFSLFLSHAVDRSERILSHGDGDDDDDTQKTVISLILEGNEVTQLFYTIQLVEFILSHNKKGSQNVPSSYEGMLIKLYNAGTFVTEVFSSWLVDGDDYEYRKKEKERTIFLMKAMSKTLLSNFKNGSWSRNVLSRRQCMMKAIADITVIGWTSLAEKKCLGSENSITHCDIHLSMISPNCLTGMSEKQLQILRAYLERIRTQCCSLCHKVAKAFGVAKNLPPTYRNHDCICHLVTNCRNSIVPCSNQFSNSTSIILLESILPPQEFTILMTNIYLCHSCDEGKKQMGYLKNISTKVNSDVKFTCLNSLAFSLLASQSVGCLATALEQANSLGIFHKYLWHGADEMSSNNEAWTLRMESLSHIMVIRMNLPATLGQQDMHGDDKLDLTHVLMSFDHDSILNLDNTKSNICCINDPMFFDVLLKVVQKVAELSINLSRSVDFRNAMWNIFSLLSLYCPAKDLERISAISIPIADDGDLDGTDVSSNSRKNKDNQTTNIFDWLLRIPFTDDDESLRLNASKKLGMILFHDNCKILMALVRLNFQQDDKFKSSHCEQIFAQFFDRIDRYLHKYCGITQSELSCTMRTTCTITTGTYTSSSSGDMGVTSDGYSRQISALVLISSLCQQPVEPSLRSVLIEKAAMRLVRFWVAASCIHFVDSDSSRRHNFQDVARTAFVELQNLKRLDLINEETIARYNTSFVPGLISEILSRSLQVQSMGAQGQGVQSIYEMLIEFMGSFLVNFPQQQTQEVFHDIATRFSTALNIFDSFLPSIISGFVIEQDYESLCACTGFRLFVLSELKRVEKKLDGARASEIVLGMNQQKKRYLYGSKKFSPRDLKSQTAQLCVLADTGLNVLGYVLKSLLMQRDKSSMVFFLKTVIQSKVPIGTMLKKTEFTVLEGLISDLGNYEEDVGEYICYDGDPQKLYEDHDAFRAMKQGALWLHRTLEKVDIADENSSSFQFSLESLDVTNAESIDADTIVSDWINKHFMRLLVNVTTRWKRGRVDTKILAMKSLQVLVTFLRVDDSAQYVTQILGIVDGCMNINKKSAIQYQAIAELRSLATKILSRFVRMLLIHNLDTVGENLCNVIVSLSPLFEDLDPSCAMHSSDTVQDAVDLLEFLVDGETGRSLAQYFMDVPFLPSDDRLLRVRDALKRNGVNFDNLLLLSTQMTNTQTSNRGRDSISSTSSVNTQEDRMMITRRTKLQAALKKRLHSLQKLLGHENENVRIVCLRHIMEVVKGNRDLFESLTEDEDSSLRFLTVKSTQTETKGMFRRYWCLHVTNLSAMSKNVFTLSEDSCGPDSFLKAILRRCTLETNADVRLLLAQCLGEIGAINPMYINNGAELETDMLNNDGKKWLVENGKPWKTKKDRVHYELQLVTKHFVVALKAARTPTDQHKIAFAIQEVLKSLNSNATSSGTDDESSINGGGSKKQMTPWLKNLLVKADVLSVIEPYWSTMYKQTEACKLKSPPFFCGAKSCYLWLAEWGRFMVERSHNNSRSHFRDLFFACRSAIRSEAGLGVIEFLLPVLVLDSLCFGDDLDRTTTVNELKNVLENVKECNMEKLEIQKSVECVFTTLKILQHWAENEVEDRHKIHKGTTSRRRSEGTTKDSCESLIWPAEESVTIIEDLQEFVPFSLCAQAAAQVGMHAQALRFLEMDVRKREAKEWFDGVSQQNATHSYHKSIQNSGYVGQNHIEDMAVGLCHRLLGELNDRNAMSAIARCRDELSIMDQIREKQSYRDWNGVLRLCELASQIKHDEVDKSACELEIAQVKALLELGQLDNALNQVTGLIGEITHAGARKNSTLGEDRKRVLLPFAVQASWRLGRWDLLDELIDAPGMKGHDKSNIVIDHDGDYDFSLGKAILGLQRKNKAATLDALRQARETIIPPLSVVASEDYRRAYPLLMKLQCCREIEDAVSDLSLEDKYLEDSRGSLLGHTISMETISTRLALSRIISCPEQEAHLWLSAGRKARKEGLFYIAESSLSHSDTVYQRLKKSSDVKTHNGYTSIIQLHASEVRLQLAKLKHASGGLTEALRMIDLNKFHHLLQNQDDKVIKDMRAEMGENKLRSFARSALQATEWMVESGLKSGSDAIAHYNLLNKILPDWERAHFQFAKYLETILDSRIMTYAAQEGMAHADDTRSKVIETDPLSQKYLMEAISEYGKALSLSQKHVFQALPRLLTLWTDFTGIDTDESQPKLEKKIHDINELMVKNMRTIPTVCYYSVLPQLISRIGHSDEDTRMVLCAILRKVLVKFPAQALWQLAWLRQSIHKDRREKGDEIFKGAQKTLQRSEELGMHDLLGASKDLFEFLINLAKYKPKQQSQKVLHVHGWQGNVELKEFIPPVQAALTVSRNTFGSKDRKEAFPTEIPRMRTFSTAIQLMASKARPKKITAFVVPEGSKHTQSQKRNSNMPLPTDIGEMHFLIKQEARGDLRKDARVQDLNTVINRLFTNSAGCGKEMKGYRRLTLRTYSVICLTEDCGILEWVPNTNSLRNLISSSFNPHANHHSIRRRGSRGTDFGDINLRNCFTQCQDQYMKMGNLTKAAKMFDEQILQDYPPVFYWWFIRNFPDPHQWFEARTRFALSAAAWSAVGHVIGLGDRHSENILIDTSSGDCVHVDFDCIFDKGLLLPRPEIVPFRLTSNMLDAFGPTGADGTFSGGLQSAMTTLRDNRDILLSVLEPFIRDPVIEWKRHKNQQKGGKKDKGSQPTSDAKRSIRTIDERLQGMYNLRNPNHEKLLVKKIVPKENKDDELAKLIPLSIEGQVDKMIKEATSHENLVQLYVGWMPWL